ncbi:MAG: 1-acyl-sn-glycerol-3-phosphate acyltransferase [Sphingomonadales bacterium]|nr:1-acyl-sn-glycerol-3-phosphate acyltransferase [Sphingomonadales bacterium]
MHRYYFRSEVRGIENLPPGRVLVIANHSGQLPIDGMLIGCSLVLDAEPPRFPRSMVERWTATLPFVSFVFSGCSAGL